ncbi:hypothetical protein [Subtercola lobariae]|uniref:Uncharacterized protein n=1 Tax=Subtercola lobariae TaxID=1588641 RepID=A0A917BAE0_9MICO|nr:hypothetical protein [Subtercola lobariae]GGF33702.1 hypothetical protein GCM10011399_28570 [Subtercola lobariae]
MAISLVEVHVALSSPAAVTTIAGWAARRQGAKVAIVVLILGVLGAVAVIPQALFSTMFAVFLCNHLGLLWVVVTAVWLILRRRHLTAGLAERALATPRLPRPSAPPIAVAKVDLIK